ncbi:transposase [Sphingobacterium sp. HJSM2_6]|uniref:transposase n=1 Tax=Sphingobacterium sp. HJSM2_6 TaxID=3366264 RepID=UPI003BE87DBF
MQVIDRFHAQQRAAEALQEIRIQAIDEENKAIEMARKAKGTYLPELLSNGDTVKQMLARSRYLLYKNKHKWTLEQ